MLNSTVPGVLFHLIPHAKRQSLLLWLTGESPFKHYTRIVGCRDLDIILPPAPIHCDSSRPTEQQPDKRSGRVKGTET